MPGPNLPKPTPVNLAMAWVLLLVLGALVVGISQRPRSWGRYEYEVLQPYQGRLRMSPYPALEVERPMESEGQRSVSLYPLASSRPRGFRRDLSFLDGKLVTLSGRVLCAGTLTMLEVEEDDVALLGRDIEFPAQEAVRAMGPVKLRGEILDLRSYLGYHEPEFGDLLRTPSAGAIRAGIPPVLVVTEASGRRVAFLLVRPDGAPVGGAALGRLAIPVEIEGEFRLWADFPMLAADPASYRRLWPWE